MSPALILSMVLAVFCGSLFHVVLGRRIWQWPLFIGTSLLGVFGGFLAGVAWGFEWLLVGDVPMLTSVAGAVAATALAWFFSAPSATSPPANHNR
ncbi:hypothetical protein BH23CHL2_BH23CHL2_22740 [soil metagenome]